jgi:hypothetical protein
MIRDASGHRRCGPATGGSETRMGRTKIIDRTDQIHAVLQRQCAARQRSTAACQRDQMCTEGRVEPVTVDGGITPPTPASSRVENWRAHFRWRVSSRALSIARWVHSSTMATVPAPATSNGACGFPALRFPVRFMPRVMGPIMLGALSAPVVGAGLDSP